MTIVKKDGQRMKTSSTYSWDEYFIDISKVVAKKSKDPSTKCGTTIVAQDNHILSTGYNGLPAKCKETEERFKRPKKYLYFEHSERNAIYYAAKHGVILENSKAYITGPPCCDCARGLIAVGTKEVIIPRAHNMAGRTDWADSVNAGIQLMREAHVNYRFKECGDLQNDLVDMCGCGCASFDLCGVLGCPHHEK